MPTPIAFDYTRTHYELIHNLHTDRYGWFILETGLIEAWYEDKEAALAAHPPTGEVTFMPATTEA